MIQPDRLADILILGGTRGFGQALGIDLKGQGVANLALGTSDLRSGHYQNTIAEFGRSGVNIEGVVPFEADLTDSEQVKRAIDNLPFRPAHVFMLAAGGMNSWALSFSQHVARLQGIKHHPERYKSVARGEELDLLHKQYDLWLPGSLEDAVRMNLFAPVRLLESLAVRFEEGFTFVYLDSLFGDEGRGPRFYTNVLTKHMFDIWLAQNAKSYAKRNIDTARIKAPAIMETDVGDFIIEEIAGIENPEVADKLIDTAVKKEDIFAPIYEFMQMSRLERVKEGLPFERYVYRHQGRIFVTRTFPEELRIDPDKYLL